LHYRVLFAAWLRAYLVSPPPPEVAVSNASTATYHTTGPRALANSGSSSHARRPLQSMSPLQFRTAPAGLCTFHGIWLSIVTPVREVHLPASSHTRLCSALSVSHALDGLRLHAPCKLVSSCSHVRDSLFRGCSPLPSQHGSSPCRPLMLLNDFRLQSGCPNCPAPAAPPSGS
jgi:hypothetical protein